MYTAELRKLDIQFSQEDMFHVGYESEFYFLSKVTRLVALERMPQMQVDITTDIMESEESDTGDSEDDLDDEDDDSCSSSEDEDGEVEDDGKEEN